MKGKIIRYSIICVLLGVMVMSGYNAVTTYMRLKKADMVYEELQNDFFEIVTEEEWTYEPETETDTYTEETSSESEPVETNNQESESVEPETTKPEPEETKPAPKPEKVSVNFDALLRENKDVVGWLYCPGTPLCYPVLQAEDNEKYLRADIYGNYLVSGTIFVDFRNGEIGTDRNYIIYGHHMKNRTMFGSLHDYKNQSYYDAHPTIMYLTPDCNYTIQIVAGKVIDMNDIIYRPNPKEPAFEEYLDGLLKNSTFDSGLTFEKDDRLVTLTTCSYDFEGARYVLVGKLIPNG